MKHSSAVLILVIATSIPGCDHGPAPAPKVGQSSSSPAVKANGTEASEAPKPPGTVASEAPKPATTVRHKVSLDVRSETWREGQKPFDIGRAIAESLMAANIDVVGASTPESEGMVLVTYKETKGDAYSLFGLGGDSAGNGTNIHLELAVLSPQGESLLRLEGRASTPTSVSGEQLYEAAIECLKETAELKHAGTWVRAAFGSVSDLRSLLPELADRDSRAAVLGLVERLTFEPTEMSDRAWLALGQEDFEGLIQMGSPAVEPLLAFLEKYWWPEDCAKAAAALAKIGDPRAAKPVVDRAIALGNQTSDSSELAHVLSVMESAGRVGDAFSIVPLDEFSRRKVDDFGRPDPEVQQAAAKAVAAIRARLQASKKPPPKSESGG